MGCLSELDWMRGPGDSLCARSQSTHLRSVPANEERQASLVDQRPCMGTIPYLPATGQARNSGMPIALVLFWVFFALAAVLTIVPDAANPYVPRGRAVFMLIAVGCLGWVLSHGH